MIDTDLPQPCSHGICLDSPDGCRFGPDGDCHQAGSDTMAQPFTDADVELVARTLWEQCGVPATNPTPICYDDARAVLSALAAAGRLADPVPDLAALSGYELGVVEGRRRAAADIRAEADDESKRASRTCCSHAIEQWLREAAYIAEKGCTDD